MKEEDIIGFIGLFIFFCGIISVIRVLFFYDERGVPKMKKPPSPPNKRGVVVKYKCKCGNIFNVYYFSYGTKSISGSCKCGASVKGEAR